MAARTSSSGTKCRPEDETSSPTDAGEADGMPAGSTEPDGAEVMKGANAEACGKPEGEAEDTAGGGVGGRADAAAGRREDAAGEADGDGSGGPGTGDGTAMGAKKGWAAGEEEPVAGDSGEEERTAADARTAALSRRGPAIRAAMLKVLRVPLS